MSTPSGHSLLQALHMRQRSSTSCSRSSASAVLPSAVMYSIHSAITRGGIDRRTDRMSSWTRFRVSRVFRWTITIGVLIAGRVVQGLGAGVGPLTLALACQDLTADRVPRVIGES